MESIEKGLEPLSGYLISIKRNTQKGWYELEVGVPSDWIYKSNDDINCEVEKKTNIGHILKISPQKENITVDDLVAFVKLIIDTNQKIREKEKQFTEQMDRVKKDLENRAKEFYSELETLKENSFKEFNTKNEKQSSSSTSDNKKEKENSEKENDKIEKESGEKENNKKVTTDTTTKKRGRPPKKSNKSNEQKKNE